MSPSLVHDITSTLAGPDSKRCSLDKPSVGKMSRFSLDTLSDRYSPNIQPIPLENGNVCIPKALAALNGDSSSRSAHLQALSAQSGRDGKDGDQAIDGNSFKSADPIETIWSFTAVDLESSRADDTWQRQARPHDGYFVQADESEGGTKLPSDGSGMAVGWNASQGNHGGEGTAPAERQSVTSVLDSANSQRSSTSGQVAAQGESGLKSTYRISSPAALQVSRTGSLTPSRPTKLQHRHTLETQRPAASSMSREVDGANYDSYASGRFSPSSNTGMRRRPASMVRRATRSAHSDFHLDTHRDVHLGETAEPDEAERWAEMIKAKRAIKRRRREDDDERVLMGTKVDQNHVNYITAYNMLTGLRFTVSRTNAKLDRHLVDADFNAKHKFSFDVTGNELTPSAKYDFKFKDYAPWVFRHLRTIFRIDPADYLMSLTSKYILSELGSPGKSGSFFYFSRDYKYIIKTIHHAEHKLLYKILRDYHTHVRENPNTLLSQFYGLHRVKVPYGRKIHFVVMNNLFPPHRDIHQTFDLKGSTIGRDYKEDNLSKNPRATLKDLNWLRRNMHLELGPIKKQRFIEQMHKDVALLQKLKIMDYSMLVGIHDLSKGNEDNLRDKTLKVFQPGGDRAEEPLVQQTNLTRTPSKMESQRKANELRVSLMQERPVPVGQTGEKMPEDMPQDQNKDMYFYSDDRGFRATYEDDTPGEQIYYLGIIDCLTHYGLVKRLEHFWKGIKNNENQISPVPPERYGERFVEFIGGVTKHRGIPDCSLVDSSSEPAPIPQSCSTLASPLTHPLSPLTLPLTSASDLKVSSRPTPTSGEKPQRLSADSSGSAPNTANIRAPSPDFDDPYTLPVVEEAAESASLASHHNDANDGFASSTTTRQSTASTEPKMPDRPPPLTPPEIEKADLEKKSNGGLPSKPCIPPLFHSHFDPLHSQSLIQQT